MKELSDSLDGVGGVTLAVSGDRRYTQHAVYDMQERPLYGYKRVAQLTHTTYGYRDGFRTDALTQSAMNEFLQGRIICLL